MFNWFRTSPSSSSHFRMAEHGAVTVIEPYGPEIRHPEPAAEFGADVRKLAEQEGHKAILIDLRNVRYFSSTGFAVILGISETVKAAGGRMKICNLHPDVALGANIIGLGRMIETYPNEKEALESF